MNAVKYFPPNEITDFLEVYKLLMYRFTVLPFSLQYLTNADYLISC